MSTQPINPHIEAAITFAGGPSAVARRFKINPWAVSKWRQSEVPPKRVLALCRFGGWQVTPHQIAPDLYPNPDDGLPVAGGSRGGSISTAWRTHHVSIETINHKEGKP